MLSPFQQALDCHSFTLASQLAPSLPKAAEARAKGGSTGVQIIEDNL